MSTDPESLREDRSTLSALAVFVDRRTLVMLALGVFAGGFAVARYGLLEELTKEALT